MELLQPLRGNGDQPWRLSPLCRQAVNFVHDGQTCLTSLLGFPTDPRLSHSIILVVDGFGIGLCTRQQLPGCREENPIRLLMPDDLDIQKRPPVNHTHVSFHPALSLRTLRLNRAATMCGNGPTSCSSLFCTIRAPLVTNLLRLDGKQRVV
jgi:hypothetical protein